PPPQAPGRRARRGPVPARCGPRRPAAPRVPGRTRPPPRTSLRPELHALVPSRRVAGVEDLLDDLLARLALGVAPFAEQTVAVLRLLLAQRSIRGEHRLGGLGVGELGAEGQEVVGPGALLVLADRVGELLRARRRGGGELLLQRGGARGQRAVGLHALEP